MTDPAAVRLISVRPRQKVECSNGADPVYFAPRVSGTSVEVMTATVRSLMGSATPSMHATDSLLSAARKLRAHGTDAVLVHGDDSAFVGMITRTDIIDRCVAAGGDPANMTAGSLITAPCAVARPDDHAGSPVIEAILRQRVSFLPVVDDGRLVGIITLDAIAAHLVDSADGSEIDLDTGAAQGGGRGGFSTASGNASDAHQPTQAVQQFGTQSRPDGAHLRAPGGSTREQLRRRA